MLTLNVIAMKIDRFPWNPACAGVTIKKPAVIFIPSSALRKGMVIRANARNLESLPGTTLAGKQLRFLTPLRSVRNDRKSNTTKQASLNPLFPLEYECARIGH